MDVEIHFSEQVMKHQNKLRKMSPLKKSPLVAKIVEFNSIRRIFSLVCHI